MFILTTAPKPRRTQAFAITQRTLTTLLIETADEPRPLLRRHPASLQTPPPTHPFLYSHNVN
jgi:hypothetical protein